MQIRQSDNLCVAVKRNGIVWSNLSGKWLQEQDNLRIAIAKSMKQIASSGKISEEEKNKKIDDLLAEYKKTMPSEEQLKLEQEQNQLKAEVADALIAFFKDFEFEPSFRFVNTLAYLSSNIQKARDYISNLFDLADNQYKNDVKEKMKSAEFTRILSKMSNIKLSKHVNSRLKVYYGPQGTGKTTDAMLEAKDCIVCNSSMLPSDLLEDFAFKEGKPGFNKSALWLAMEQGTGIVLDEINLLPFESVRFLQGITDNKSSFIYKGQSIYIKEGFKIIGTMNLRLNGSCYGLPEPLLDRAYELKKYELTASQLANAF